MNLINCCYCSVFFFRFCNCVENWKSNERIVRKTYLYVYTYAHIYVLKAWVRNEGTRWRRRRRWRRATYNVEQSLSQYEANPTTNNINYKKQHKNIEAQVHLTKGQNDRQSDREKDEKRESKTNLMASKSGGEKVRFYIVRGNKNQAKGKCSLSS